jgi:hypothetical protein
VPLRPVSELGLVDVTDLAARESGEKTTPRPPTRARTSRPRSRRRDPGKDPRGGRTVDQSEHPRASTGGGGKARASRSKSASSSTPERGSKRSGSTSNSARNAGSDGAFRSASAGTPKRSKTSRPRSRSSAATTRRSASPRTGSSSGASARRLRSRQKSHSESPGDSRGTQNASSNGQPHDETNRALEAKLGISALTGAIGIAGGLLLARTALQRKRKIVGIPLPSRVDIDLGGVTARIGKASRRLGKLAGEVGTAREKTEQIGRALG